MYIGLNSGQGLGYDPVRASSAGTPSAVDESSRRPSHTYFSSDRETTVRVEPVAPPQRPGDYGPSTQDSYRGAQPPSVGYDPGDGMSGIRSARMALPTLDLGGSVNLLG